MSLPQTNKQAFRNQVAISIELIEAVFEAINFPLDRQAGVRAAIRLSLDAKLHLDGWFDSSDYYYGMKLLGIAAKNKSEDTIRQTGRREREKQIATAKELGYTLIQFAVGGRERNNPDLVPGKMRLPVLDLLEAVNKDADEFRATLKRWDKAIHQSVQANLFMIRDREARIERFERVSGFVRSGPVTVEREAKRLFNKAIAQGINPFTALSDVIARPESHAALLNTQNENLLVLSNPDTRSNLSRRQPGANVENADSCENPQENRNNLINDANNSGSGNSPVSFFDPKIQGNFNCNEQLKSALTILYDGEILAEISGVSFDQAAKVCREAQNIIVKPVAGFLSSPVVAQGPKSDPILLYGQISQVEHGRGAADEALACVEVFESIGTTNFDLTKTDIDGQKTDYAANIKSSVLKGSLPALLNEAADVQENFIIRPKVNSKKVRLIQLDDISGEQLRQAEDLALLILETSTGNYQAWVAVELASEETARQLKKFFNADVSASGATRIAGSLNYKPDYAPNFPRVKIYSANPGRLVTIAELDLLGMLPVIAAPAPPRHAPKRLAGAPVMPSYAKCLESAPPAKKREGNDRSIADFNFCLIACDRGFDVEVIAELLILESTKAKEKGHAYALHTAKRAASMVEKKRGKS